MISFLAPGPGGRPRPRRSPGTFFWAGCSPRAPTCSAASAHGATSVDSVVGFILDELREMYAARLYPPVPVNSLRVEADDVLPDGTAVQAGWFVADGLGMGPRAQSLFSNISR